MYKPPARQRTANAAAARIHEYNLQVKRAIPIKRSAAAISAAYRELPQEFRESGDGELLRDSVNELERRLRAIKPIPSAQAAALNRNPQARRILPREREHIRNAFASALHHEVNNAIQVVQGYSEMFGGDGTLAPQHARRILEHSKRICAEVALFNPGANPYSGITQIDRRLEGAREAARLGRVPARLQMKR